MNMPAIFPANTRPSRARLISLLALAAFALVGALAAPATLAQDQSGKSAGIYAGADATAKDVGLPIYPGARPHKDKNNDTPMAKFGLWGGSWGVKFALLQMESNDPPDMIAAYYKKALAKYGAVLDCSHPSDSTRDTDKGDSSKKLTCGDDKPDPGEMLFKSGTKDRQHIVGVTPNGTGAVFHLVYLQVPADSDKDK